MSYSQDELSILTPDERDALLADAETADVAQDQEAEILAEEVADAADPVVAEEEAYAEEVAPEVVAEEVVEAPPAIEEFRPELTAALPEGFADNVASLDAKSKELITQFQEGNIDIADFVAQKAEIDAQLLQLKFQEEQAKWAQSQNENARAQRWEWEQERFFGQKSSELYKDPLIMAALDASVKFLAADVANAKKPAAWFLEEADRQVRSRFNLGAVPPVAAVKPSEPPKPQPTIKTIGGLPAAAPNPVGDDIMSKIGLLEGEDLEKYFAKLSPADVEKLVRSA